MKVLSSLVAVGLLAVAGCSAGSPELSVKRATSDETFVARFERAYFSETQDGKLDLVLLADGTDTSEIDRPLTASGSPSLRQVVHIRLLWQHVRGIRLDNPSSSNAMIQWHIIGSDTDRLLYTGSCWAQVSVDGDEAEVDLRNATVAISQIVGSMNDPLKRALLEGVFVARRSDAAVRTYVEEIAALQNRGDTAISVPPQRHPSIP